MIVLLFTMCLCPDGQQGSNQRLLVSDGTTKQPKNNYNQDNKQRGPFVELNVCGHNYDEPNLRYTVKNNTYNHDEPNLRYTNDFESLSVVRLQLSDNSQLTCPAGNGRFDYDNCYDEPNFRYSYGQLPAPATLVKQEADAAEEPTLFFSAYLLVPHAIP